MERKTETAQQDHPEKVGFDAGAGSWTGRKREHASHGPLGAQQGLFVLSKAFHRKMRSTREAAVLPRLTGLVIINFVRWWSSPSSHEGTSKHSRAALEAACKDGDSIVDSAQLADHHRHIWVSIRPWTDSQPIWPKKTRRPIQPIARGRDAVASTVEIADQFRLARDNATR